MPQFVYFVEGNRSLADAGLSYAFEKAPPHADGVGPDGKAGRLFSADPDAISYDPERQNWLRIAEGVHVGCLIENKPTPADLEREHGFDGEVVRLPGGDWQAPRLRIHVAGQGFRTVFPTYAEWRDGEWYVGEVLPEHEAADKLAEELIGFMLDAADGDAIEKMTDAEPIDYAVRCLQINYRVGPAELTLLKSVPIDDRLRQIIHIATDYQSAIEHALGKDEAHAA